MTIDRRTTIGQRIYYQSLKTRLLVLISTKAEFSSDHNSLLLVSFLLDSSKDLARSLARGTLIFTGVCFLTGFVFDLFEAEGDELVLSDLDLLSGLLSVVRGIYFF